MELKSSDLMELKQEVLKQSDDGKKSRIVLTGDKPIMVATTIFTDTDNLEYDSRFYEFFKNNGLTISLLDSFIYSLYKYLGIYGVIDYIPMNEAKKDILNYKQVRRYYYDKEFKRLLESAKIDALYSLNNGRFIANRIVDNLGIHELNSSFSFMGLTGVTNGLTDVLDKWNIEYHCMFGGGINNEEFRKIKLQFTDDTIKFNELLKIGKVKNRQIERKNLWPRMLDISINDNMNLNEFYKLFTEYINWALNELQVKGTYEAMSPMKRLEK